MTLRNRHMILGNYHVSKHVTKYDHVPLYDHVTPHALDGLHIH